MVLVSIQKEKTMFRYKIHDNQEHNVDHSVWISFEHKFIIEESSIAVKLADIWQEISQKLEYHDYQCGRVLYYYLFQEKNIDHYVLNSSLPYSWKLVNNLNISESKTLGLCWNNTYESGVWLNNEDEEVVVYPISIFDVLFDKKYRSTEYRNVTIEIPVQLLAVKEKIIQDKYWLDNYHEPIHELNSEFYIGY